MLVGFSLKSPGACVMAAPPVACRQPLVTVEEIDVGRRHQINA
jgi:hypothetical protein